MNAQRLVTLVGILAKDLKASGVPASISQVVTHVEAAINAPNEANQRSVETSLDALLSKLRQAPSNSLSPGYRADLEELSVGDTPVSGLVGIGLADRINRVFERGSTSVKTLDELRALNKQATALEAALQSALTSFNGLGLQGETLSPGESVVGVTVPRLAVNEGLRKLQSELRFFEQLVAALNELVDGDAEDPQVLSLRSSDYGVDVAVGLDVAALMAMAVRAIKMALDKVKEFRDLKKRAEELGVEEDVSNKLTAQGKKTVAAAIEEVEAEIFQHCKLNDKGRVNELRTAVRLKLNGVANRMERGFSFEVRTMLPTDAPPESQAMAETIVSLSELRFDPTPGPLLLQLPEGDAVSDAADSVKVSRGKKKKTRTKKSNGPAARGERHIQLDD